MKKLLASLLLVGLVAPSLVAAQQIPTLINTGVQPGTFSTILTNDPGSNGLVTDIQQLRLRVNQLFAILNSLYAILKARQEANTPPPPVTPPQANNKIKISLSGLKSSYNLGEAISFNLAASRKEGGPNELTLNNLCQVRFSITKVPRPGETLTDTADRLIYDSIRDSATGWNCGTATSSVVLPKTWALNYTNNLPSGSYNLTARVIDYSRAPQVFDYGKSADWYFNVKRPGDPTITLDSPTGVIVWTGGTTKTIKWSYTNAAATDNVQVALVSPGSEYFSLPSLAGTPNDKEQDITLPTNLAAGNYELFVRLNRAGGAVADSLPRAQVVIPDATRPVDAPFISNVSPIIGPAGTEVKITGTGFTSDNTIKFGSYVVSDDASSSDSGTEIDFAVPSSLAAGTYALMVTNANGSSNSINFVLTAGTTDDDDEPVATDIEVMSPTVDNESWALGATKDITWTSDPTAANGGADTVNIRLVNVSTNQVTVIKMGAPNTGTYSWTVGNLEGGAIAPTGRYKFRICPTDAGACDKGSNNIKIVAGTTASAGSQTASTAAVLQGLINQLNGLLRFY